MSLCVVLTKFALIPRVEQDWPNFLCAPAILSLAEVPFRNHRLSHLLCGRGMKSCLGLLEWKLLALRSQLNVRKILSKC